MNKTNVLTAIGILMIIQGVLVPIIFGNSFATNIILSAIMIALGISGIVLAKYEQSIKK